MSEDNLDDALKGLRQTFADHDAELAKMADECDPELKLAVTQWVMKHIVAHASEGGSYRYLIYDRLGFGPEAYAPLCSDGLTISNEFDLNLMDSVQELFDVVLNDQEGDLDFIKHQFEKMKQKFALCDEPGCSDRVTCGWPSDNGYRSTCSKHYHGMMKK